MKGEAVVMRSAPGLDECHKSALHPSSRFAKSNAP